MAESDFAAHRAAFRRLHEAGCFVIPNPWDVGSARYLQSLGFPAIATTSAGFAFSQGLPDSERAVPRDAMLRHIAELTRAVEIPVNADFESGYADEPADVAHNVSLCIDTGVAGLSIEDRAADPHAPLYDLALAVERVKAARVAIDSSRAGVLLTARAECYLVHHPDPLRESIHRLQAYSEAGADVLYAPGPTSREDIEAIVAAVSPKPVNVLMSANTGLSVADVAALGARRISVGSSLARAAWTGFLNAARAMAREGSFRGFDGLVPYSEINGFFQQDSKNRAMQSGSYAVEGGDRR